MNNATASENTLSARQLSSIRSEIASKLSADQMAECLAKILFSYHGKTAKDGQDILAGLDPDWGNREAICSIVENLAEFGIAIPEGDYEAAFLGEM